MPKKRRPEPQASILGNPEYFQLDLFYDRTVHIDRPRTRGDCKTVPRPCPYVSCRSNLSIDIMSTGSIRWRQPDEWTPGSRVNCALDFAEKGPFTLGEIGDVMGVSRERIRQEAVEALRKLRENLPEPMRDDLMSHIDLSDFE